MCVKNSVPTWRDTPIVYAHGNILNSSYAYVYCTYEFTVSCVYVLWTQF